MSNDLDWQILDRYLAGAATPEEAARARTWLAESPELQQIADALTAQNATPSLNVDAAWRRVASRTVLRPSSTIVPLPRRRFSTFAVAASFAAAAAIIAAVSLPMMRQRSASVKQVAIAQATWRDVEVPRGSRVSIDLPDGSSATLNAGSHLRYDSTGHDRDVFLRGEGYFVVKHDSARPFTVHANGALIRDVGTRFVVRAYDGQAGATVVVAEGAVNVRRDVADAGDSVTATQGMLARLTSTGSLVTSNVDPAQYLAFANGRLVLDGVTLAAAVPMLERWYNVDIRLTDSVIATRRVTAEFHDESASEAMQALSVAFDLDVARSGRSFTVGARKARQ